MLAVGMKNDRNAARLRVSSREQQMRSKNDRRRQLDREMLKHDHRVQWTRTVMIIERTNYRSHRHGACELWRRQRVKHQALLRRQLTLLCAYRGCRRLDDWVTARASLCAPARCGLLGGVHRSALGPAAAFSWHPIAVRFAAWATAADAISPALRDRAAGRGVATQFFVTVTANTHRMRESRQEKRGYKQCRKRSGASARGDQPIPASKHRHSPLATTALREF